MERHPHLAARRHDVDRPVWVHADEGAVGARRLGELLDLVAQGGELLLGLLERQGELLVLRDGLAQPPLRLKEPLFECLDSPRLLVEPSPQRLELLEDLVDLALLAHVVVLVAHPRHHPRAGHPIWAEARLGPRWRGPPEE